MGPTTGASAVPAVSAAGNGGDGAFRIKDPRITESSGLAASRTHKGVYWTHNDSDDGPYVYAVDSSTGRTVATVTLKGIDPRDLEAVSAGPGGEVYVGDIGDNLNGGWNEVWIYRFDEPEELRDVTVTPTRYTVRYADGPRDAESLMVHPKTGRVYIASKSQEKKGGVYAGPERLTPSGVNTFRRIARTEVWATDGAFSPDGTRLVLRGYFGGEMFRWRDGKPEALDTPVSVPVAGQGESVTFTADGRTLMCGSEGKGSTVDPLELDGELLPESVPAGEGQADGGTEGGGAASGGDEGKLSEKKVVVGGAAVAVAVVLWTLLRRIFRRRG
ncbi:hypothetical protein DB35_24395 [Streptomyces abyssalis]|uniref:WD40 repeat domain-containing protein n=1 Tax=Streptomyces abyssalis TaxID=933944 RepID=A0A1E7JQU1_9ACTN|nr:hypothetical protein DB35_24395 [Streptomyces abyssalis]OEU90651.1 hypothetical protein AN215_09155 [Streptomyces abyssalis]OEV30911.1 hypothetical protein AN219_08095 [Streptomyces nanshensis]